MRLKSKDWSRGGGIYLVLASLVLQGINCVEVETEANLGQTKSEGNEQTTVESSQVVSFSQLAGGTEATPSPASVSSSISIESSSQPSLQVQTKAKAGSGNPSTLSEKAGVSSVVPLDTKLEKLGTPADTEPTITSTPSDAKQSEEESETTRDTSKTEENDGVETSKPVKTDETSDPSVVTSQSVSVNPSSSSAAAPLMSQSATEDEDDIPIPTHFPKDDLDGYAYEFEEIQSSALSKDFRLGMPHSSYTVVPTKSLQAIEMTTATYDRINPNRVGLIDETTEDADHFLVNRASHKSSGGPLNQDRLIVDDLEKQPRNNDRDENVPKINDILSGLLSVMGEGLNFATNYVQENNRRKQEEKEQLQNEISSAQNSNGFPTKDKYLFPKRNRTRVNNRGPPRISEIPFEAIPLEVLNAQQPGGPPIIIPQRPFQTRLPGGNGAAVPGIRPPNRQPPPYKLGVPLPESLLPGEGASTSPSPLPTRPGYEPAFLPPPTVDDSKRVSDKAEDDEKSALPGEAANEDKLPPLEDLYKLIEETSKKAEENTAANTPPDRNNLLQNILNRPNEEETKAEKPDVNITEKKPELKPVPESTSTTVIVEVEPSFPSQPALLVTPPPNRRRPYRKRPPRPPLPPNRRPQTSVPTPPLNTRPLVFPTRPVARPQEEIVTGVAIPADNAVFDLTVTAQQSFGGKKKPQFENFGGIITKARPGDQYVSIDGKRTYFDLGGGATKTKDRPVVQPTKDNQRPRPRPRPSRPLPGRGAVIGATLQIGGEDVLNSRRPGSSYQPPVGSGRPTSNYKPPVGSARPVQSVDFRDEVATTGRATTTSAKPGPTRRPLAPPVRIDTCIVGDDNTCRVDLHEVCRTHLGVSSCYCKPGYGRKHHRLTCKKTVRLLMSLKLDRMQDKQLVWNSEYMNQNSERFQILEGEANYAIDSAMALTSFSNLYMGNSINTFYPLNRTVTVNTTIEMEENGYTRSNILKRDLEKKLVQVIQARGNNIGNGNLYVAGLFNPIPDIRDFNECSEPLSNDCGENSECINTFGGFTCQCSQGYEDKFPEDKAKVGRFCESCPADYCSNRGKCGIEDGQRVCLCTGNYYGEKCEVDGEVLAVAIGASVAAVIIILLTLICLCMWSRRWKREQEKVEMSRGFSRPFIVGTLPPPPSYHPSKVPSWAPQPSPAYPRWNGHMDSQQNIYAPVVYGGSQEPLYMSPMEPPHPIYGTLGGDSISVYGTIPRRLHRVVGSEFTPFPSQYATLRGKERLSNRPSLKSLGLMEEEAEEEDRRHVLDDVSSVDSSSSTSGLSLKEKLRDENLAKITRGITFQSLKPPATTQPPQPEPGARRPVQGGRAGNVTSGRGQQKGPLPSLPRPSTALGTRGGSHPLIETSESDDTEPSGRVQRPRSSMMGNLNADEDFESDYLRYGGTVGVRNPRLVAAMRGQYQQHIQMNMLNRF